MATLRKGHPHLKCIVTADSLSANAPPIVPLRAHGLHAIRRVKDGNHASLGAQGQAADQAGRVTYYAWHDRAGGDPWLLARVSTSPSLSHRP